MGNNLKDQGFTLVEIMIVIAVIGVIIAIAIPAFLRAREVSRARGCQENLTKIEGAVDQYTVEFKLQPGDIVAFPADIVRPEGSGYLKTAPRCPASGIYDSRIVVDIPPKCSIGDNPSAPFAPHVLDRPVPSS